MDKLYPVLPSKNTPSPSKASLLLIKQFAAVYQHLKTQGTNTDFIAN